MERKLTYDNPELKSLVEKKYSQIDVLNKLNKEIQTLMDTRDEKGAGLDETKKAIVKILNDISKKDMTEFEMAQTTEIVDDKVEIVVLDLLEKAKEQLRNTLLQAKQEAKKESRKRKKK